MELAIDQGTGCYTQDYGPLKFKLYGGATHFQPSLHLIIIIIIILIFNFTTKNFVISGQQIWSLMMLFWPLIVRR
jgi:hypothetical protein